MRLPDFLLALSKKLYSENSTDRMKDEALHGLLIAYKTAVALTDGAPTQLSVAIAKVIPKDYLGACRDEDSSRIKSINLI